MKTAIKAALVVSGALAASAVAHHSSTPHFDNTKKVEVEGTVTKFSFVNPHAYIYFNVADAAGKKTLWRCEMPARAALEKLGWSATMFPAGEKIKVVGQPARREDNVCYTENVTFADGRVIGRNAQLAANSPATAAPAVSTATPRAARTADGKPNLAGFWVSAGMGGGMGGGMGAAPAGGTPPAAPTAAAAVAPGGGGMAAAGGPAIALTPAGEAASKAYDERFDDPALKCNPGNIIFGWTHDQNVNRIVQGKDKIVLTYGYMDFVRTIHMNMAQHPKKITPSTGGHSIGKWDGDTLVVDTIGFKPSALIPIRAIMHSDQLSVIERFTLDNTAGTLTREYVATDPLYLQAPYTNRDVMNLSAKPYTKYNCVELSGKNNIRPK
jgi:hypothetical protein